jgi:uncharacterized protein YabN with tetrapyrrole methylase and pyrophosphatase domain
VSPVDRIANAADAGAIERLLAIMARLRHPQQGCPWDLAQDFSTIAPYTLEEAYEVDDAIRRGDFEDLCDELGDLLLQVVYHARMAEEAGHFGFPHVVAAICDKLVRRHPHVFGEARIGSASAQARSWDEIKAAERRGRAPDAGVLDGVPAALPALARAVKLQRRAVRAGLGEPAGDEAPPDGEEELGDRLFALASLASEGGLDPERALRDANARFEGRVRAREAAREREGARERGQS